MAAWGRAMRAPRRGGAGCLWALALLLSAAFVVAAACLLYLVVSDAPDAGEGASPEPTAADVAPAGFADYSWEELSQVAALIAAAESDEAGAQVAAEYGVFVGDARPLELADGTVVEARVVGLRHDSRSDGQGRAGITLMLSPVALRPMCELPSSRGGWEASSLRAWLADEGLALLPADLASVVVPVAKATNNVGVTADPASVSVTSDLLWAFSAVEVCGTLTWFSDEFGSTPTALNGYVDFPALDALLCAEGAQYEYFASAGVTCGSDPSGVLRLAYGGSEASWWYRTPYPYSFDGSDAPYFYQAMASGYPASVGMADVPAGVVVGVCL